MLAPYRDVHYEHASASLLAATPAFAPPRDLMPAYDWQFLRNQLEQRVYGLRQWRYSWWAHWALLAEYILPRRYRWLVTPNNMVRGVPINQAIVDPTGTQALRVCSAGLVSGLMSASDPWFKLSGGEGFEADFEAQQWFDMVEERIYTVMAESNFYKAGAQMFEDLPVFGTAPMLIYEHPRKIIHCYTPCAGEYFLANGSDFTINTFARIFVLTLLQLVEMFGLDNIGPEAQQLWGQKGANLETEFLVAHLIEPNFPTPVPGAGDKKLGVVAGGFAYREIYWLYGRTSPKPLSVRGFREFPLICPRWATTANDSYGRSCGMDALPDIMQLQVMTRRDAEAIEKMVRPPMQADARLKNQPSSTLPGKITYVTDIQTAGMKPIYEVKPDVEKMGVRIEALQKRIERWFFNDIFMAITNMQGVQPRNEFEIAERKAERLQVLGPVIENFYDEAASPAIQRVAAILKRRNMIPPLPDSLRGIPVQIEYISKLALAQRAGKTAAMEQGIAKGAQMAQLFPTQNPLDNIDPDVAYRQYLGAIGFPSKSLRSNDQRDKIRQQQQQALQQQQQKQDAAGAVAGASQAADAAKSLSDTDVGQGQNALELMLGNRAGVPLQ